MKLSSYIFHITSPCFSDLSDLCKCAMCLTQYRKWELEMRNSDVIWMRHNLCYSHLIGIFQSQKDSNAEIWCFHCCQPEQVAKQTVEMPLIWSFITLMWCYSNYHDICFVDNFIRFFKGWFGNIRTPKTSKDHIITHVKQRFCYAVTPLNTFLDT